MARKSWIVGISSASVTLPITALAVLFAISNRDLVAVQLWPLPGALAMPLYILGLLAMLVGFLLGGGVSWINAGHSRRRARRAERDAAVLARELGAARRDAAAARQQA